MVAFAFGEASQGRGILYEVPCHIGPVPPRRALLSARLHPHQSCARSRPNEVKLERAVGELPAEKSPRLFGEWASRLRPARGTDPA